MKESELRVQNLGLPGKLFDNEPRIGTHQHLVCTHLGRGSQSESHGLILGLVL